MRQKEDDINNNNNEDYMYVTSFHPYCVPVSPSWSPSLHRGKKDSWSHEQESPSDQWARLAPVTVLHLQVFNLTNRDILHSLTQLPKFWTKGFSSKIYFCSLYNIEYIAKMKYSNVSVCCNLISSCFTSVHIFYSGPSYNL